MNKAIPVDFELPTDHTSNFVHHPRVQATMDYFEFFEEAFNEPKCLLLLKSLLLENSSMQIFLYLSKDEHSNTKRNSISFIEDDNEDYDIVKVVNHEMKCLKSLSSENNVWKMLRSHFPRKIIEILDAQTLYQKEIIANLKSKVGSVFHAVIRAHQMWNIYNHAFHSRYEVGIL